MIAIFIFLGASSSSRSLAVCWSVGLLVGLSGDFVKKLPLKYQMVTKTYLKPIYLPTYVTVVTVVTIVTLVIVVKVVKEVSLVTQFFFFH